MYIKCCIALAAITDLSCPDRALCHVNKSKRPRPRRGSLHSLGRGQAALGGRVLDALGGVHLDDVELAVVAFGVEDETTFPDGVDGVGDEVRTEVSRLDVDHDTALPATLDGWHHSAAVAVTPVLATP